MTNLRFSFECRSGKGTGRGENCSAEGSHFNYGVRCASEGQTLFSSRRFGFARYCMGIGHGQFEIRKTHQQKNAHRRVALF